VLAFAGRAAGHLVLFLLAALSVLAVFVIFFFIIREALPFFQDAGKAGAVSILERLRGLFGSTRWYPEAQPAEYGALALLAGSLLVTICALAISVPVGLLAAVCLGEIFPFRLRQAVKPVVELLAAIPSVAYGFFAALVLAPWMQRHWGFSTGANALNASLMLAIMAIPTIVSVSEDSLAAIGRDLREASLALGATRAETTLKVVIPAAHHGIIAAIILGMMRAVGETMAVWMASGNAAQIPSPWWNLTQSIRTLTATIAGEMGETVKYSPHYHALFTLGLILLLSTFILNLIAEVLLRRARRAGGTPT
jgi:phosphate transport system permease protein